MNIYPSLLYCTYIVIIFYLYPFNAMTMKTKLIRIGNSQGVRIPKPLIEESGLEGEIEMILRDNEIILRPAEECRSGWDEVFEEMAGQGDDRLLDREDIERPSEWDESEWTW